MPAGDEYASAGGAGKLRLKGSKGSGDRVEKKQKKKHKKSDGQDEHIPAADRHARDVGEAVDTGDAAAGLPSLMGGVSSEVALSTEHASRGAEGGRAQGEGEGIIVGKTEAERRHEEIRRRRLQERLKREGSKSHKERVEEFNKYLSKLSEHHDMPRIGPG